MKIRSRRFTTAATILVAVVMFGVASTAEAGFAVRFTVGATQLIVNDGDSADFFSANNEISVIDLNVGGFAISFTGSKTNTPGLNQVASLNISSFNVGRTSDSTTDTIVIETSASDFNTPVTPPAPAVLFEAAASGNRSLVSPGSISGSFTAYVDQSNTLFGTTGPSIGFTVIDPDYSGNDSEIIASLNPSFSMTLKGVYTLSKSGTQITGASGNATLSAVPEPSTFALAALAVPFLVGHHIRRRMKMAA